MLAFNRGNLIHGRSDTPTYNSWRAMRNRCSNPHNTNYPAYGGSGVSVCPRWRDSFKAFLREMGERNSIYSMGRNSRTTLMEYSVQCLRTS